MRGSADPRSRCWVVVAAVGLSCAAPERVGAPPFILGVDHEEPELVSVHHVVQPGENLYRIARAYGLSAEDLAAANGIADAASLRVGTDLVIPGATEEIPAGQRKEPEESAPTVVPRAVPTAPPNDPRHGKLQWPLRGVLYGAFGKKGKEAHDGIDLAAPAGTAVRCAGDGTVLYAGEQRGYGQIVIVQHAEALVTLYAHNQSLRVKSGQAVKAGDPLATVGESGRTSGPHLHFEVRKAGTPVNPLDYLGPPPKA